MRVRVVTTNPNRLPRDDDHPYRTGAHRPNLTEYDATDLDVVAGELPRDLEGVYLRNTENPLLPALGRYHPFDGDGMLHAVHFHDGKADYRNRVIRTEGLQAELAAGEPLWAGIVDPPSLSKRDGWGARTRMKDAASTDVVVHRRLALATFYQCGDAYQLDPVTLGDRGPAAWAHKLDGLGVSAHTKVDERTGELLFFNYGTVAPYFHYGVLGPEGRVVHHTAIPLPGPRLPHDLAFTERYVVVNDFPYFWDPAHLARGLYRSRYYPDMPSRFGVIPRRGGAGDVKWFEAAPTYVLHWANAYEDGDEVVLEGFHQSNPSPGPGAGPGVGKYDVLQRSLDMHVFGSRLHRWRFDLKTGQTREQRLDDDCAEFPTIHGGFGGRKQRFVFAMVGEPGGFLFSGMLRYDMQTGERQRYSFPKGVFASESPVAPRAGGAEADAYVVTLVSDLVNDVSECQVFDGRDIVRGPIARVRLPERISSGTHACWAPKGALG
jgi:carotenoid cleavage dioxygenase